MTEMRHRMNRGEVFLLEDARPDPVLNRLMRGVVARHALGAEDARELVAMLGIGADSAEGGDDYDRETRFLPSQRPQDGRTAPARMGEMGKDQLAEPFPQVSTPEST